MAPKRPRWMEKRELQGYGYDEIVAEIDRRVAGEYHFPAEQAQKMRKDACAQIGILFRFSAMLHDFLKKEELTLDEFFAAYQDDDPTHRYFLTRCADPFSRGEDITSDTEVDTYYPGEVIER